MIPAFPTRLSSERVVAWREAEILPDQAAAAPRHGEELAHRAEPATLEYRIGGILRDVEATRWRQRGTGRRQRNRVVKPVTDHQTMPAGLLQRGDPRRLASRPSPGLPARDAASHPHPPTPPRAR